MCRYITLHGCMWVFKMVDSFVYFFAPNRKKNIFRNIIFLFQDIVSGIFSTRFNLIALSRTICSYVLKCIVDIDVDVETGFYNYAENAFVLVRLVRLMMRCAASTCGARYVW